MITEPVPVPLKTRRSPQITPIRASS